MDDVSQISKYFQICEKLFWTSRGLLLHLIQLLEEFQIEHLCYIKVHMVISPMVSVAMAATAIILGDELC